MTGGGGLQSLLINGGKRLSGEVWISGSKNAVLPMLAATVLFQEPCCIRACPNLTDVDAAIDILNHLGAKTMRSDGCLWVDPRPIYRWDIPDALVNRMRGSVFFAGALMARMGKCRLIQPGGCSLGKRPVNFHVDGLMALGAKPDNLDSDVFSGPLTGAQITLPYPSVGATENLILAGIGASGVTTIRNAAREPEITCLCDFLRAGGCGISGDGSLCIQVDGGLPVSAQMRVIPDRMEAATFACAAASAGGDVLIRNAEPNHFESVIRTLQAAGCQITRQDEHIRIQAGELISPGSITTEPYPGFPTDAQAPVMAALLRAKGTTMIHETVFSERMNHISGFNAMGAHVEQMGGSACIHGVDHLTGSTVTAQDLRGGAALAIAALAAHGKTTIHGLKHILRGYEDFAMKLRSLGADVRQA